MSRWMGFLTVLILLELLLSGCGGSPSSSTTTTTSPSVIGVAVSQGNSVNVGATEQLTATASYTNNTSKHVTSLASWTSSNPTDATVSSVGLVAGVAAGTVTISAAFSGQSGNTSVTVDNVTVPTVTSIAVGPEGSSVNVRAQEQMDAVATYSDGSTKDVTGVAIWISSNTSEATVSATTGVVTGVAPGTVTITASFGGQSGSATVTVNSVVTTVTSVAVSPPSSSVNVGAHEQMDAKASYSDGSVQDVTGQATWVSSNTSDATVLSTGQVTGVAAGTVTITASFGGQSGSASVTVNKVPVTAVVVTSSSTSAIAGFFLPLTATANYSDGTTSDVTTQAAWTSSNPADATVSTLGVVHGTVPVSSLTITASFGGQSGQMVIAVVKGTPPGALTLAPGDAWAYLNSTLQMSATYTPSGGTPTDVTSQTTWISSNPSKASVDPTGLVHGLVSDGEVLITGTYVLNGVSNTATTLFTVSHAPLADNTPLMDMTAGETYMGFEGNLYENSKSTAPVDHDQEGITQGAQIQPLDLNGISSPNGAVAFISVGLSNTSLEFGGFVKYVADPSRSGQVNARLAVLNGAKPGEAACAYTSATDIPANTCTVPPYTSNETQNQYDRIRDEVLATATSAPGAAPGCGTTTNPCLSEKQAVWLKEAEPAPEGSGYSSLCDQATPGCADNVQTTEAYFFEQEMGEIARALRVRYPNLKQVFLASRIYAGYIIIDKSPEPYAYEYGFSAKWLIQAQINQSRGLGVDPVAGDLNYTNGTAPWIAWGPYLWADGANPRADGLVWIKDTDYQTKDYQHPSTVGINKVDGLLFTFFTTSAYTPWFRP